MNGLSQNLLFVFGALPDGGQNHGSCGRQSTLRYVKAGFSPVVAQLFEAKPEHFSSRLVDVASSTGG
jgi:hypothetical protein